MLPSDNHDFIGRVIDLSIVSMSFESYEEIEKYGDAKYVLDVNFAVSNIIERVESLNLVGSLLWPKPLPNYTSSFPISSFEWLTIAADVFLMRYISVLDCAIILTNEVYECGLERRRCSIEALKKNGVDKGIIEILRDIHNDQGALREERNARFHHGIERAFTSDDLAFRVAERLNMRGEYEDGRKINVRRTFKEGLVELQKEFNTVCRKLVRRLDRLYDILYLEFNIRFSPKFQAGFGAQQRR
jgi:hypothetical protein